MIVANSVVFRGGPEAWARGWRGHLKEVMREVPRLWHKKLLRDHFAPSARRKYKYKPRSRRYRERKRAAKGHGLPLVYSGQTRRAAATFIRTTGTSSRSSGRMVVPFWVHMKPKRRNAPALGEEMTRVTQAEQQQLADFAAERMAERLDNDQTRIHKRIPR